MPLNFPICLNASLGLLRNQGHDVREDLRAMAAFALCGDSFCVEGFSSSSLHYIGAFFASLVSRRLVYGAGQLFYFVRIF